MSGDDQEKIIEGLTQYFEAEPNLELTLSSDMWDEATHKMRACNREVDQSLLQLADTTLAHVKVPVNVRSPLLQLADVPGEVLDDNARGCDTSHKADVTDRSPPQQPADLPADVLGDNARGGDESHKPDVTDRAPLLLPADVPAEVLDDNARLGDTSHKADVTDRSPLLQLADVPAEVLNDNAPAVEEDTGRLSIAVRALLQVQKRTNRLVRKHTSSKRPAAAPVMRATRAGKKCSVSLMADRHLLQWKLKNRVRPYTFEIFMPPQKVASTSARCLWAARQGHPVRKGMLEMKGAMHRACHVAGGISMDVDQCDFASGNDLYGAAVSSVSEPWIARDQILCFSHQNNHSIVDTITSVIGLDAVSKLQTASSYFKMGSHLDRCSAAALGYVSAPG